jgi:hypothetical protein
MALAALGGTSTALADATPRVALEPLETSPAGDRFFLAPDARVSDRDGFAAKLFESYAYRPLLHVDAPGGGRDVVDSELYFDVGASYSLLGRALFAVDLPIVPFVGGATDHAALGDLRLAARLRLVSFPHGELATETRVSLPSGNADALTGDDAVRTTQLVTFSGRYSSLVYTVSAGYLARKRRDVYGAEVGPAIPFSAAVGFDVAGRLQIGPEIQGFTVLGDGQTLFADRTTPLLGLLGARFRVGSLVLGGGAGPGLSHAPGVAPHVVFNIAWEPPPRPRGYTIETSRAPTPPTTEVAMPARDSSPPILPSPSAPLSPPPPPSASAEDARLAARALFQQGIADYDAREYERAVIDFTQAYAMRPHPAVLRNIGLAELMQGDRKAACVNFKRWRVEARPRVRDIAQIADSMKEACR